MSSSTLPLLLARPGASRAAPLAARAVMAARSDFFYGYWFSHERA